MAGGKMYRYPKKNTYRKATLTRRVNKIAKTLRQNKPEKKHFDKALDFSCTNNEAPTSMCDIAEGIGSGDRIGLRVRPLSLHCNYQLQWNNTATQQTSCRVIIFLDKESDGAVPTRAQIFEGGGTANTTTLLNNINEGSRFVILYNKIHNNRNASQTTIKDETYSLRLKLGRKMHFRDGTGGANAKGNNMIYIIGMGDVADATGTEVEVDGNSRLYFQDS